MSNHLNIVKSDDASGKYNQRVLSKSGGGDNSGGMEARVAVLEAHIGHIKDDLTEIRQDVRELRNDAKTEFRITFGALITVALGLAALMAKGFKWF